MKRLFALTTLVLLLIPQLSLAKSLREEVFSSVVQIVAISEDGEVMGGSGTTISSDGLILTNYHVVQDMETQEPFSSLTLCYTISQYEPPRCAASATIVASLKEYDLALVRPDKRIDAQGTVTRTPFQRYWRQGGNRFVPVLFKNPATGVLPEILDSITAWGYPVVGGSTVTVTRGTVSGFSLEGTEKDRIIKFLKTDVYINPGNSGGAAFDEYYSFVGVPSNAFPGQLGFVIPVNAAVEWMKKLHEQKVINIDKIESMRSLNVHFTDIPEGDPLQSVALMLKHLRIITPNADGTFAPDALITRALAAEWIARSQSVSVPTPANPNASMSEKDFRALLNTVRKRHSPIIGSTEPLTRAQAALIIFDAVREN